MFVKRLLVSLLFWGVTCSIAGTLVDNRDGRKYKTIKIGEYTWMAENLKYKASPSYCFGGKESNCQKFGRMYPWHTAMKLPAKKAYDDENVNDYVKRMHQGICPSGWHVPTVAEFDSLSEFAYNEGESFETSKMFGLKYGGQLMILGAEYYRGYVEDDPTAAARFFKTGKRGEFPLRYLYKDFKHIETFSTTEAEDASVVYYSAYRDRYNFEIGPVRVYRGASANYLRCVKNYNVDENGNMVQNCEKGFFYQDGECRKPYDCGEFEYAVDKWTCAELPENAKKNKGVGFTCKKGFDKVKLYEDYDCIKPYDCSEDEFFVSKYECQGLPKNARRKKNKKIGFECDDGFDKVEINEIPYCRKPYICEDAEYSVAQYECASLPKNAHRLDSIGYACDDGFDDVQIGNFRYCRKPYDCGEKEYSVNQYECANLPANSHKNESQGFDCDEGYYKKNQKECENLPANAHENNLQGFDCEEGFYKKNGSECIIFPMNAHAIGSNEFECDEEFFKKEIGGEVICLEEGYECEYVGDEWECTLSPSYVK
ncbi:MULTISPECIES: FISUMP domain-containing protein [unclassified Fibrobacter]|uniref:FISUMP domain-containing protein n=1 Tax=unclassified Fibrobacter TaxID=2634177 RepID=UPI00091C2E6B|nr:MULTISPECIES: FISUMP domain-containing protein [unclassified Fibrobacter]OWV05489.1 hypothetical protein B7993_07750 [Fibrobacter sp. UWH3]SHK42655.1 major paralogous domain-containing protein [Fibrobacter sp. UWH6]